MNTIYDVCSHGDKTEIVSQLQTTQILHKTMIGTMGMEIIQRLVAHIEAQTKYGTIMSQ